MPLPVIILALVHPQHYSEFKILVLPILVKHKQCFFFQDRTKNPRILIEHVFLWPFYQSYSLTINREFFKLIIWSNKLHLNISFKATGELLWRSPEPSVKRWQETTVNKYSLFYFLHSMFFCFYKQILYAGQSSVRFYCKVQRWLVKFLCQYQYIHPRDLLTRGMWLGQSLSDVRVN